MNFVDAAVSLLREAEAPLHVEDLCRLALERGLLDSPGANPLRSFKGRLTTELKRGDESRVVRVEDDLWSLSDAGREGGEAGGEHEPELDHEQELETGHDRDERLEDRRQSEAELYEDRELPAERAAEPAGVGASEEDDADDLADELEDELEDEGRIAEPARELSPEEEELV